MVNQFARLLTRDRTAVYPWFAVIGLAVGWLVTASLGPGWTDLSGNVVGNDFLAFYSASELVAEVPEANPYDLATMAERQRHIIPEMAEENMVPYLNPPAALLWYAPLHHGSYGVSLVLWMVVGLLAWGGAHLLMMRASPTLQRWGAWRLMMGSLLFPPTLMWVIYGQATGILLLLLAGSYAALVGRREFLSGLLLGLMLFKPQLALGLALPLVVARRWSALTGGTTAVVAQLMLTYWLWPEQYAHFLAATAEIPAVLVDPGYPLWGIQSVYGFWHLLIGGFSANAANALNLLTTLVLVLGLCLFWLREPWQPDTDRWKVAIAGTMLISLTLGLHLFLYDLALLVLPFWIVVGVIRARPGTDPALDGGAVLALVSLIWCLAFAGPYVTAATGYIASGLGFPRFGVQVLVPMLIAAAGWLLAGPGVVSGARRKVSSRETRVSGAGFGHPVE